MGIAAAGVVWPDSSLRSHVHLQPHALMEQRLQTHSCGLLLRLGHHVAGLEVLLLGSLLCGLPHPHSSDVPLLGTGLPSRLLQR